MLRRSCRHPFPHGGAHTEFHGRYPRSPETRRGLRHPGRAHGIRRRTPRAVVAATWRSGEPAARAVGADRRDRAAVGHSQELHRGATLAAHRAGTPARRGAGRLNPLRLSRPDDRRQVGQPTCCWRRSPSTTRCRRVVLDIRILSRRGQQQGRGAARQGRRHLRHQRHRVRHLVLGAGPRRAVRAPRRRAAVSRLHVPSDDGTELATPDWRPDVRRLPLRQHHQRGGVLPHRHHAAGPLGQGDDVRTGNGVD